jgi:signal peptidase I
MSDTPEETSSTRDVAEAAEIARKKKKAEDLEDEARFRSNVKTIVSAVALAVLIRIVIFEAFEIDGPSMQPTLLHVDRVIVAKCLYGLFLPRMNEAVLNWGHPDHGDVVIVRSPADEQDIVKRVIGLPGDTVEVVSHHPVVNGRPLLVRETGRVRRRAAEGSEPGLPGLRGAPRRSRLSREPRRTDGPLLLRRPTPARAARARLRNG